jgi:membrane protease YdiL (CAAX protease family)
MEEEVSEYAVPLTEEEHQDGNRWLLLMTIFYGLQFLVCLALNFTHRFQTFRGLVVVDVILFIITFTFLYITRKHMRPVLKWDGFSLSKILIYGFIGILVAVVVYYSVKWLNRNIFDKDVFYYNVFRPISYPKIAMLALIALYPAIVEELAFRGILQEGLLKCIVPEQVVYVNAFLFAIIHMSLISFFGLPLPYGLGKSG